MAAGNRKNVWFAQTNRAAFHKTGAVAHRVGSQFLFSHLTEQSQRKVPDLQNSGISGRKFRELLELHDGLASHWDFARYSFPGLLVLSQIIVAMALTRVNVSLFLVGVFI